MGTLTKDYCVQPNNVPKKCENLKGRSESFNSIHVSFRGPNVHLRLMLDEKMLSPINLIPNVFVRMRLRVCADQSSFFTSNFFSIFMGLFFCSHVGMGRSPPLSLKLKDPCPVAIKQPHTIILPSPNFKTGTMQSVKMHFLMWSTVLMQLFIIIHRYIGIY